METQREPMLFEEHGQWPCPAAWVNQPLGGCTERSGVQLGVLLKATNLQETTKKPHKNILVVLAITLLSDAMPHVRVGWKGESVCVGSSETLEVRASVMDSIRGFEG